MTDAASTLSAWDRGARQAVERAIARARASGRGRLSPDDLVRLLPDVELSVEVLDEIRRRCEEAGVVLEESGDLDIAVLDGDLTAQATLLREGRAAAAERRRARLGGKKSGENVTTTS